MSVVGENIKRARESLGLSQNQLARKAGIAQPTLSAIEKQTKSPSIDTVILLAAALGKSVGQLVGEDAQNEKGPVMLDGLDECLKQMLVDLSPAEIRRVQDFCEGIKAGREV